MFLATLRNSPCRRLFLPWRFSKKTARKYRGIRDRGDAYDGFNEVPTDVAWPLTWEQTVPEEKPDPKHQHPPVPVQEPPRPKPIPAEMIDSKESP